MHHERLDGTGYPNGSRAKVRSGCRFAYCMSLMRFDAITSDRPYQPAMPIEHAVSELTLESRNTVRR